MKLRVNQKPLLDLLAQCTNNNTRKQAKLKTPERLQELLNICRSIWGQVKKESEAIPRDTENDLNLAAIQGNAEDPKRLEAKENMDGWRQVIAILEEGGHFSGINRKSAVETYFLGPNDQSANWGIRRASQICFAHSQIRRCFDAFG